MDLFAGIAGDIFKAGLRGPKQSILSKVLNINMDQPVEEEAAVLEGPGAHEEEPVQVERENGQVDGDGAVQLESRRDGTR